MLLCRKGDHEKALMELYETKELLDKPIQYDATTPLASPEVSSTHIEECIPICNVSQHDLKWINLLIAEVYLDMGKAAEAIDMLESPCRSIPQILMQRGEGQLSEEDLINIAAIKQMSPHDLSPFVNPIMTETADLAKAALIVPEAFGAQKSKLVKEALDESLVGAMTAPNTRQLGIKDFALHRLLSL